LPSGRTLSAGPATHGRLIVTMVDIALPPLLEAWGCDQDLWSKIRSKKPLIEMVESGDEAAARERLDMLRRSPSISGDDTPCPAQLAAWGCDEELWGKIRSKKPLLALVDAGDEQGVRERLEKLRGSIAAEVKKPARSEGQYDKNKQQGKAKSLEAGYVMTGTLPTGFDPLPVEELFTRRVAAKLQKDYDLADKLQQEIVDLGVYINDHARTWNVPKSAKRY